MAAHSTMVRRTAAPVPSAGSGSGGHGWRRLAGIVAGNGRGEDAQAVRTEAHSSGSSRVGRDDTLHLPGDGAALGRDAGTVGLEAGRRAVGRALRQALALGIGRRAPAVGSFPAQALQPPGTAEARSAGQQRRGGEGLHASPVVAAAEPCASCMNRGSSRPGGQR